MSLIETLLSILRVILLSRFFLPKIERHAKTDKLFILGNGPSLNLFLSEHAQDIASYPKLAVNYFARTVEYTQLKPDYYLIISPEYFRKEQKKGWAADREKTLEIISEKTDWSMVLMLPSAAKGHQLVDKYFHNHNFISLYFINNTPIDGFKSFRESAYQKNLGIPRPHNVLIPAIWFGIKNSFKEIYLTGSDHSWLRDLWVTQENEVLLSQKHFYDQQTKEQQTDKNKPTPQAMYHGTSEEKRKLHEVLHKFMVSFQSYWVLKAYAESRSVNIYNLTLDSYIDAFEKRSLNE